MSSILDALRQKARRLFRKPEESVILEVTQECNLKCSYCYNVWKCARPYPAGQLDTEGMRSLIGRIVEQTGCRILTFTGGEPYLRDDLVELMRHAQSRGVLLNVITNGTLLTEETILDSIRAGVTLFEVQLPATERPVVQGLMGRDVYDDIIGAISKIKKHDGLVVAAFVATSRNIGDLETVVEMCFALGVDGLMFNRFNPGGEGAHHVEELSVDPQTMRETLSRLDGWSTEYRLPVSCSIAMPPCFFDHSAYPHLSFGFCSAGGEGAYYTIDPLGNVRMCNHSPTIVGNLLEEGFRSITRPARIRFFTEALCPTCAPCPMARTCQGGCKAAAESCTGSLTDEDPYLRLFKDEMRMPTRSPR
jgi:radical SAM protein with 4Fe4S-binding SPASM domain